MTLKVFDVSGRLVRTLVDGESREGHLQHDVDAEGNAVSSGVYFYRLTAHHKSLTRKAVLLK